MAAIREGFVASGVIVGDHFRYSIGDDAIFRTAQTQHRTSKLPTRYPSGTKYHRAESLPRFRTKGRHQFVLLWLGKVVKRQSTKSLRDSRCAGGLRPAQ